MALYSGLYERAISCWGGCWVSLFAQGVGNKAVGRLGWGLVLSRPTQPTQLSEFAPKFFDLRCRQLGTVSAFAFVDQASDALVAIDSTPTHQAALTASGDRCYFTCRVASSVQSHSLVSGSRWAIFALVVRIEQLLCLFSC
jgi:hypothetical protein